MDRYLTLFDINIKLLFDVLFQIKNSLSCNTIENAAIIRWSQQFDMTISAHLQHEHVQDSHLFDIIVEEPENIIEAVVLSICNNRNKRAKISSETVLTMTKWPILVDRCGAFERDWLLFEQDWI